MNRDLINAIRSGNVRESLELFGDFICGGREQATNLLALIESKSILDYPETIQMVAAIYLNLAKLAAQYEYDKAKGN